MVVWKAELLTAEHLGPNLEYKVYGVKIGASMKLIFVGTASLRQIILLFSPVWSS